MSTFIVNKFNSLFSFADFCDNTPTSEIFEGRTLSSECGDQKFTGTPDFQTANNLLRNGDKRTADKVRKEYTNIVARTKVARPRPVPAIVGHTPIVGAYLASDPVCMLAKKNRPTRARVITIVYNISVSYKIKANDLAKAGANLLAAINQIEANGVRVNLYVCDISTSGGENLVNIARVKTDCQPLNIMQIAYPIANPSFLRRHIFKATEVTKELKADWFNGYGRPLHGQPAQELLKGARVKYDSYLDFFDTYRATAAQLVQKILGEVK